MICNVRMGFDNLPATRMYAPNAVGYCPHLHEYIQPRRLKSYLTIAFPIKEVSKEVT
jgi:hypothetical protein